ncbi:MAG: STAS domain-containing protein [Acutalibacteraceae bacterium]
MQIKTDFSNKKLTVALSGRLDTITSPQLEEEVNRFSLDEINEIVIDANELEYISSAGLRIVLMLHKKMAAQNGQLRLLNVNEMIKEIFDMTGMSDFLDIEKA